MGEMCFQAYPRSVTSYSPENYKKWFMARFSKWNPGGNTLLPMQLWWQMIHVLNSSLGIIGLVNKNEINALLQTPKHGADFSLVGDVMKTRTSLWLTWDARWFLEANIRPPAPNCKGEMTNRRDAGQMMCFLCRDLTILMAPILVCKINRHEGC